MRINKLNSIQPKCVNYTYKGTETDEKAVPKVSDENKIIQLPKGKVSLAPAVTIATLSAVIGLLIMSKGFQKNSGKYLKNVKNYLEERLELSYVQDSNQKTKFYEYTIKRINSYIQKCESINNITSLKDVLFMKIMYKTKPTKKIHKSISNYFEKISYKTVTKSYKDTEKRFAQMNKLFDKLDNQILQEDSKELISHKGKNYTKRELVEMARVHRQKANDVVNNFISQDSLSRRYNYVNNITSNLYSKFWNASFKDFWSKDNKFKRKEMWQTFIAAEQVKNDKINFAKEIANIRNTITYTRSDKVDSIYRYIKHLHEIIPSQDKTGQEIIKKVEWLAEHSEDLKYNNNSILTELSNLEKHEIPYNSDGSLTNVQDEYKKGYITMIRDLMNNNERGELQEMMALYYKAAPFELTKSGAALSVKKAVKSFDKSVNLESIEFFDKVRDLKLGSAPTDVLTILLSFLAMSAGFGYARDRDERISIMFKSGIPVGGGIVTTVYTATKLVSGGKSLAIGLLSGIVLNRLGVIADSIVKNKKSQSGIQNP